MFPVLGNVCLNITRRITQHSTLLASYFHLLAKPNVNVVNSIARQNFLVPVTQNVVPCCGFKVVGRLRKRCKSCYFVRREERLFVICKAHPRHKQMSMIKDPKNTWILSHATQSKVRPW